MAYEISKHMPAHRRFFARVSNKGSTSAEGHLYIYDVIGQDFFSGGVTPATVLDALTDMGPVKTLHVYINSPGGDVWDAVAICEVIKRHAADLVHVHVDGLAASAASVIAMVGGTITMAKTSMMMIHDPWTVAVGGADELVKAAEMLSKVRDQLVQVYVDRTENSAEVVSAWMREETWMTAEEAKDRHFCDDTSDDAETTEESGARGALVLLNKYKKVPANLKQQASSMQVKLAHMDQISRKASLGATRSASRV